jgi:dTDP-4-amino-4,6-dideoxygalactose transaminase
VRKRADVYRMYVDELARRGLTDSGWTLQELAGEVPHQFFPLLCPAGTSNLAVARWMADGGIDIRRYFSPPCHRQPAFEGFRRSALDNTETLSSRALSLPLWEEMTGEHFAAVTGRLAR